MTRVTIFSSAVMGRVMFRLECLQAMANPFIKHRASSAFPLQVKLLVVGKMIHCAKTGVFYWKQPVNNNSTALTV